MEYAFKAENSRVTEPKDKQQPTYYELLYIISCLKQCFINEQLAMDVGTEDWSRTAFQPWQLYEKRISITANDRKVK